MKKLAELLQIQYYIDSYHRVLIIQLNLRAVHIMYIFISIKIVEMRYNSLLQFKIKEELIIRHKCCFFYLNKLIQQIFCVSKSNVVFLERSMHAK